MKQWRILIVTMISVVLFACSSNHLSSSNGDAFATNKPKPSKDKSLRAAASNVRLSAAYLSQGEIARAKSKILEAYQQAPDWPPVLDGMAYYYGQTGETKQAEEYYLKAISMSSGDGESLNNYGVFLCDQKRYQEAIEKFVQAAKETNYVTVASAYENAGICASLIPNQQLAEKYYLQALEVDPQSLRALLELSRLRFQQDNAKEAYARLQTYFALSGPKTPDTLWLSYQLSRRLGRLNEAASTALLLKGKFPNSSEAALLRKSEVT